MPGERQNRSTLKVFYSEDMVSDAGVRASPSDRKPRAVAEALLRTAWPLELVAPVPTPISDVCRVHDPSFVDDVLQLRRPNGFGSFAESVARSVLYTCGACHDSSLVALKEGISASLTSGFHHAGPRAGRAFCTFNGLMVTAAQLLDSKRVQKLVVLDCDYHYGDGTQAIIDAQGLDDRVLHISFGQTFRRPDQAEEYLATVSALRARFEAFAPDLIIYQAGADVHIDDPLGGLLTTGQMRRRDQGVFAMARDLSIPLTWNLAGGYQIESDGSIPRVVQLHLNTFEEALRTWQLEASGVPR
jgi:acetoin utilization deacetylase AcuC-like enzyme